MKSTFHNVNQWDMKLYSGDACGVAASAMCKFFRRGIAKKVAPGPMISRLPLYAGHEWRVVGTDLVLVVIATAVVVDILIDVFG